MFHTRYNVELPDTTLLNCGYAVSILSYETERALAIFDALKGKDEGSTDYYALPILPTNAKEFAYWQNVCIERSLNGSKVLLVDWPVTIDETSHIFEAVTVVIEKAMRKGLGVIFARLTTSVTIEEASYRMTSDPSPVVPELPKDEEGCEP